MNTLVIMKIRIYISNKCKIYNYQVRTLMDVTTCYYIDFSPRHQMLPWKWMRFLQYAVQYCLAPWVFHGDVNVLVFGFVLMPLGQSGGGLEGET